MKYEPTPEQHAVIEAAGAGKHLVVQAGAGAGKTSTLEMVGHALAGRKVAYIAYNRVTKDEAKRRFPPHVHCATAHGLAKSHRQRYQHRLNNAQRQRAEEQAQILGISQGIGLTKTVLFPRDLARMAMEAVTRYCHSDDPEIGHQHLPEQVGITDDELIYLAEAVLPYARHAWTDIRNIDGQLKFEHDHYFKMWALSNPRLPYDVIMLDEAQDTNPALAGVVATQSSQQILVGDSNQQLYSWRGAVDALENWHADERLTLRQSWRFGEAIADEANFWLRLIGTDLQILGNPGLDSSVGHVHRPHAILCRTNAEAVKQVMDVLNNGRKPALVGGGDAIKRLAEAAQQLKRGKQPSHRELFAFRTWSELQDYVDNDHGGRDLRPLVDLIDEHGVETILDTVDRLADTEDDADVVISTAHKSKGREWDTVTIAEDFPEPAPDNNGNPGPIPPADAMLAYVAITRARQRLDPAGLDWIFDYLKQLNRTASGQQGRTAPSHSGDSATTSLRFNRPVVAEILIGAAYTSPTDVEPGARDLAAHVERYAGPVVDRISVPDLSGNTGGYSILVCNHRTTELLTLVTTGLRFALPAPDTEVALSVSPEQGHLGRELLDTIAVSLLVDASAPELGDWFISRTSLLDSAEVRGVLLSHHPYFGSGFTNVRDTSSNPIINLWTLLPLIGTEAEQAKRFGSDVLLEHWQRKWTNIADLTRNRVR
ncbi:UvrD-helicase domain-containing protein [Nocardia sp. CA2R105]|nr:UvrD-helicase domain-containing protein [Nocardia coffeae]